MSERPPGLPQHVSANGAELWDWAGALSEWSQRQHQKRLLRKDIAWLGKRCGSCRFWMQSRNCLRERADGSGFSRGPSMEAPICGKFEIKAHTAELIASKRAELDALEARQ